MRQSCHWCRFGSSRCPNGKDSESKDNESYYGIHFEGFRVHGVVREAGSCDVYLKQTCDVYLKPPPWEGYP